MQTNLIHKVTVLGKITALLPERQLQQLEGFFGWQDLQKS
jgi:hypothetical protein